MSRPIKEGLDYFPLDVTLDEKFELIEADYGLVGFGLIIKLFQRIYDNGYYYQWDTCAQKLLAKRVNADMDLVVKIVESAISYGLFNKHLYDTYQILTSKGIQKQFISSTQRRGNRTFIQEYLLIDVSNIQNTTIIPLNGSYCIQKPHTSGINDDKSTQSKVKESKVKESKEEARPLFFEDVRQEPLPEPVSAPFSDIDRHIKAWNSLKLPKYRFTSANIRDPSGILRTLSAYTDSEIEKAMANYAEILKEPIYEPFPVFSGFEGFMATGVEKYCDEADPRGRCLSKTARASPVPVKKEKPRFCPVCHEDMPGTMQSCTYCGYSAGDDLSDPDNQLFYQNNLKRKKVS